MEETKRGQPTRQLVGNWVMRLSADGAFYYPSDAERNIGAIRVRERQRPLRPVSELLQDQVARMRAELDRIEVGPFDPLTTEEGEYGVFSRIMAIDRRTGKPMVFVLAFVFGDEWYTRFDGWMHDTTRFEGFLMVARDAVQKHCLMLGQGRARRFFYTPPVGWQPLQRGLVTQWFPLAYPRHPSVITVLPAFRTGNTPPSVIAEALISRRFLAFQCERTPRQETLMLNGLGGIMRHDIGHFDVAGLKSTDILTASLVDHNKLNTYIVRLETNKEHVEQDRRHMYAIVKSIRALPGAPVKTLSNDVQSMWVVD